MLLPRSVGRFAFGRLVGVDARRVQLQPLAAGARQIIVTDAPWLAVARKLVREL